MHKFLAIEIFGHDRSAYFLKINNVAYSTRGGASSYISWVLEREA